MYLSNRINWVLGTFLVVLPSGALFAWALWRLLPPATGRRRWLLWLPPLVLANCWLTPLWSGDENVLLLFAALAASFLLAYGGPPLGRVVVAGICYLCLAPSKMMYDTLYIDNPFWELFGGLPQAAIFALAVWLLTRGSAAPPRLPVRLWALLGLLGLAPLLSVLSFSIWRLNPIDTPPLWGLVYTALPFALLSGLVLLVALVVLARHQQLAEAQILARERERYYQTIQQEQAALRTLRHDLRNHVAALQGLLAQGQTRRAADYLQELAASPALQGTRRYCANEAANAVLSSKQAQLEALGLTADFTAELPAALPLGDADLCALLGNALDNAITAAAQAGQGSGSLVEAAAAGQGSTPANGTGTPAKPGSAPPAANTVMLRATTAKGLLMLQVKNPYTGTLAPGLPTTKPDAAHHGLGLAAMRDIAARHGGTLATTAHEGWFELVVSIPLAP